MHIVMMTNTYLPHVGGVARSVESFSAALRQRGHEVLVVAPVFEGVDAGEEEKGGVVRVPAIQNFNGSDFSVRLPIPGFVSPVLDDFGPQLVHAHHPFLLGDTALGTAASRDLPLVFTHHTMYERYTHYVPGDSPAMKRFAVRLATEYANLCDHVIAPSESIARVLGERGVSTPITAIPTGIDPERFRGGSGARARERYDLPADAFVVGHVGRLAPEKNLEFLSGAVAGFLAERDTAHFVAVGDGPSREAMEKLFEGSGLRERVRFCGSLDGKELADAYCAMDVFAFASKTETQGMVLAEAMTAGVPVVAIDAPGVREVTIDGENGRLLSSEETAEFIGALESVASLGDRERGEMIAAARRTAESFSIARSTDRLVELYSGLLEASRPAKARRRDEGLWAQTLRLLEKEWDLWSARTKAAIETFVNEPDDGEG